MPKGCFSIKRESSIGFVEMVMAADLDRSVASVCDLKSDGRSVLVQDNVARCCKNLARYHDHVLLDSFDCDAIFIPILFLGSTFQSTIVVANPGMALRDITRNGPANGRR